MLSQVSKDTIRLVIHLAARPTLHYIRIRSVAEEVGISYYKLAKVAKNLARVGVLESYQGPNGGIRLNQSPHKIYLLDMLEAVDGSHSINKCLLGFELCSDDNPCPLHVLVKQEKVALPLYPQFGTQPNIYYIPPRWAPRPYLQQMFGPGVVHAIDRYAAPSRELMAVLQLFRAQREIIYRYKIKNGPKISDREVTLSNGSTTSLEVYNDTVTGYNKAGKACVEITVEEPLYERPDKHFNSI